jgi:hypothetical protein
MNTVLSSELAVVLFITKLLENYRSWIKFKIANFFFLIYLLDSSLKFSAHFELTWHATNRLCFIKGGVCSVAYN